MFTHEEIWVALDRLAAANNYSTSGLAKKAGLDPTTFNKSKRITADGKPRWPSTESISKSLAATEATLMDLIGFIENTQTSSKNSSGMLLDSFEFSQDQMKKLNRKSLTNLTDLSDNSFSIILSSPQWAPTYKKGTTLIASPVSEYNIGDVIFIETTSSQFFIMAVDQEEENTLYLRSVVINEPDRRIEKSDILQSSKILWASQ